MPRLSEIPTGGPSTTAPDPSIYEELRDAILRGELRPGEHLVEATLAESYGVSRTPIREALRRLEQDGVVTHRERSLVVRESSPEEILDLYETRIVLEVKAAEVAADRRDSRDILRMRALGLRMTNAHPAVEGHVLAEANRQFHRAVWRASHNDSLIDLLERLNLHLGRYPETTLVFPGRREAAIAEHDALVDAIEARDSDRATSIAQAHFASARDIRVALWNTDDQLA